MTLAVSIDNLGRMSNKKVNDITVTFSSNYATNGEAFTANAAGLNRIDRVYVTVPAGYVIQPNIGANGTQASLLVYQSSTTTSAVLAELSAAGYPNALTNGVVKATVFGV